MTEPAAPPLETAPIDCAMCGTTGPTPGAAWSSLAEVTTAVNAAGWWVGQRSSFYCPTCAGATHPAMFRNV